MNTGNVLHVLMHVLRMTKLKQKLVIVKNVDMKMTILIKMAYAYLNVTLIVKQITVINHELAMLVKMNGELPLIKNVKNVRIYIV